jgi:hypothetical protein
LGASSPTPAKCEFIMVEGAVGCRTVPGRVCPLTVKCSEAIFVEMQPGASCTWYGKNKLKCLGDRWPCRHRATGRWETRAPIRCCPPRLGAPGYCRAHDDLGPSSTPTCHDFWAARQDSRRVQPSRGGHFAARTGGSLHVGDSRHRECLGIYIHRAPPSPLEYEQPRTLKMISVKTL